VTRIAIAVAASVALGPRAAAGGGAAVATGVVVETATAGPACRALEAVAAALETSPAHWIERSDGDLARRVRVEAGQRLVWGAEEGAPAGASLAPDPLAAAERALRALGWAPPEGLSLARFLAPTDEAWAWTCRPAAPPMPAAWALAATGPFLTRLEAVASDRPFERGAAGPAAQLSTARTPSARRRAWRALERDLENDVVPPVWVGPRLSPAARFVPGGADALRVFDDGRFIALNAADGEIAWSHEVGTAEPIAWSAAGLEILVTDAGLLAFDAAGAVAWRREGEPFGELAVDARRVCAAEPDAALCVETTTGRTLWSVDLGEPAIGGPLFARGGMLLPTRRHLELRDADDGRRLARVAVPGDWSAPPLSTPHGLVWVFTGSDQARVFDPARVAFVRRFADLPALDWPPTIVHDDLVFEVARGDGTALWRLDPERGPTRWLDRASRPIVPLPDFLGVAVTRGRRVEGTRADGSVRFSLRLDTEPTHAHAGDDYQLWAAPGRAWLIDGRSGRRAWTAEIRRRPVDVAWSARGGAWIADTGEILGLATPGDPRRSELAARARIRHTELLFATGRAPTACRRVAALPSPSPRELTAALACRGARGRTAAREVLERAPAGARARERARAVLSNASR